VVLLRPCAVVLCRAQTGISRHSTAGPSLAEEGECYLSRQCDLQAPVGLTVTSFSPASVALAIRRYSLSTIQNAQQILRVLSNGTGDRW
jgi:hypothetical protein